MTIADKLTLLANSKESLRVAMGLPKSLPFSEYYKHVSTAPGTNPDTPITNLFAGGKQGLWYDPSDLSTLYQDAEGTVPVTKDGDPVGKILDKSGNNHHLVQYDINRMPVYKTDGMKHWISSDGSNDIITSTGNIDLSVASISIVSATRTSMSSGGILHIVGDDPQGVNMGADALHTRPIAGTSQHGSAFSRPQSDSVLIGSMVLNKSDRRYKGYFDGVIQGTNNLGSTAWYNTPSQVILGANRPQDRNPAYAESDFYGAIMVQNLMSDADRVKVEQYLTEKLNVGNSVIYVPDDYILSYKFNGNVIDDSSNSLDGVKVGSTSFEDGRKPGTQCIRFTAGAVKTPTAIPLSSPQLTISYWVKIYEGGGYIFEMSENHNDKLNAIGSTINADGKTQLFAVTNANHNNAHYEDATLKDLGVWQHVVITVNRNLSFEDEIKIYVDKELVSTIGGGSIYQTRQNLTGSFLPYVLSIGSRWGTSSFSKCAMQDFRVYGRVLTIGEILGLYEE